MEDNGLVVKKPSWFGRNVCVLLYIGTFVMFFLRTIHYITFEFGIFIVMLLFILTVIGRKAEKKKHTFIRYHVKTALYIGLYWAIINAILPCLHAMYYILIDIDTNIVFYISLYIWKVFVFLVGWDYSSSALMGGVGNGKPSILWFNLWLLSVVIGIAYTIAGKEGSLFGFIRPSNLRRFFSRKPKSGQKPSARDVIIEKMKHRN